MLLIKFADRAPAPASCRSLPGAVCVFPSVSCTISAPPTEFNSVATVDNAPASSRDDHGMSDHEMISRRFDTVIARTVVAATVLDNQQGIGDARAGSKTRRTISIGLSNGLEGAANEVAAYAGPVA